MPRLVEVAVCDVRVLLEAYHVEHVVPVRYLPGVDVLGVLLPVVPEEEGVQGTLKVNMAPTFKLICFSKIFIGVCADKLA